MSTGLFHDEVDAIHRVVTDMYDDVFNASGDLDLLAANLRTVLQKAEPLLNVTEAHIEAVRAVL